MLLAQRNQVVFVCPPVEVFMQRNDVVHLGPVGVYPRTVIPAVQACQATERVPRPDGQRGAGPFAGGSESGFPGRLLLPLWFLAAVVRGTVHAPAIGT